jgi:ComF family protein
MGFTHPLCKKPDGVDGVKSIFAYDSLTKKIIARIKYTLVREAITEFIISIPLQKQEEIKNFFGIVKSECIIPVPLHPSRFAQRGFNQSEELARELSQFYDFSLDTTIVRRIRKTAVQAKTASYKERVANVRGAFAASNTPSFKTIVIFDDVWTTGSTVKELTRVLKKEGVEKVYALTMAQAY